MVSRRSYSREFKLRYGRLSMARSVLLLWAGCPLSQSTVTRISVTWLPWLASTSCIYPCHPTLGTGKLLMKVASRRGGLSL
jgi:hypothetical protein